jgi:hypothetical protein
MENPRVTPFYMVEVFTKPGLNTEEVRDYIISKTGMSPAIYDNGTHYVTNQQLTLDILKEISDSEDVIEVTGEYTGGLGSYGASHERSHEHSPYNKRRMITTTTTETASSSSSSSSSPTTKTLQQEIGSTGYEKPAVARQRGKKNYKIAVYTAVGIAGALALAGFIISGGLLPNSNINEAIPAGVEPGALHGVVTGPGGLPAVGATVLAVQQGSDFVASSFVSVIGDYDIRLPPGNYVVYVAYPDGTDQTATVDIQRGSLQALNFAY